MYFLDGSGITLEMRGDTEKFSICSSASVTPRSSASRTAISEGLYLLTFRVKVRQIVWQATVACF